MAELRNNELYERINLFLICFVAFGMPLAINPVYISYVIIVWSLLSIVQGKITLRLEIINFRKHKVLFLLPLYYFIHIIALLYTTDMYDGIKHLEVKASMLILPILFIFEPEINKKSLDSVLKSFVTGNLAAILICLAIATSKSIIIDQSGVQFNSSVWDGTRGYSFFELLKNNWSYYSYSSFSAILHPSYFSMYLLFSIAILVYFLQMKLNRAIAVLSIILILVFIIAIFLLGSRSGLLCFVFSALAFGLYKLVKWRKLVLIVPFLLLVIVATYFLFSSTRLALISNEFSAYDLKGLKTTTNTRINVWKKVIKQISENFIIGVGPGDTLKTIDFKSDSNGQLVRLNAHNQYLETFLGLGLAGFSLLVLMLIIPAVIAWKQRKLLFLFFLFLLSFNFVFESMLERAAGNIFMTFFLCIFLKIEPISKQLSEFK